MIARCATTKAEKEGASGIIQALDCFFSAGIFSVHSRPLTPESAATATSVVKLPMLQSEGDKVKWSGSTRKWLRHHMTEDVHSVAEGCIYLQARLPPDSTKGGFS